MEGTVHTEKTLSYVPGGFAVPATDGFLVGDAWRRKLYLLGKDCREQTTELSSVAHFCLSDAIVTTQGGIYVADVGFDFLDPSVDPVSNGIIVHIEKGGRVSLVAEDLFFPNGMVITPDQRTLIVAETSGHILTAFDIAKDGSLGDRRVWAQLPDDVNPDGICLDGEGAIWAATTTHRALRILEGGRIVDEVLAKQPVFAVMLGGPQCKHLFLCTSASSDPVITRHTPSATIEMATVNVAGVTVIPDRTSASLNQAMK
jgi:sugar lactone lactonase YvrE